MEKKILLNNRECYAFDKTDECYVMFNKMVANLCLFENNIAFKIFFFITVELCEILV